MLGPNIYFAVVVLCSAKMAIAFKKACHYEDTENEMLCYVNKDKQLSDTDH